MLKKTLIATAAMCVTLLAVATVLPALAQSRSSAPAGTTTATTQSTVGAGAPEKRAAQDDSSARTSPRQNEQAVRSMDRRKAESSERDDRHGEGRDRSSGTKEEKEKSRD